MKRYFYNEKIDSFKHNKLLITVQLLCYTCIHL